MDSRSARPLEQYSEGLSARLGFPGLSSRETFKSLRSHRERSLLQEEPSERQGTASSNLQRRKRAAVILVGGHSSRFGSNKALQNLGGKPLIRHVVDRVLDVVDEVVVVAGRGQAKAEYYSVLPSLIRVVSDDLEGKNPLIGIVAGLRAAEAEYAAILACDIPFLSCRVLGLLFRRALGADAAIPRWNRRRIEPLQAVYCRTPTLRAALETLTPSDLSIEDMIVKLGQVVYVSIEDEIANIDRDLTTFFNINTREDLTIAEKMLAGQTHSRERSDLNRH